MEVHEERSGKVDGSVGEQDGNMEAWRRKETRKTK